MSELKPCPHCGNDAVLKPTSGIRHPWGTVQLDAFGMTVICSKCGATIPAFMTEQEAIDAWNTRHAETCEPNWVLQGETQTQEFWRCECGNCGESFGVEDRSTFPFKMTIDKVDVPNFCPECGARQKAVER